jgi:hypothetical protein
MKKYQNKKYPKNVVYFCGKENEKTNMFGKPTLFKIGERPINEILKFVKVAESILNDEIHHIHFTADNSINKIKNWHFVTALIELGFYITVSGHYEDIAKIASKLPIGNEKLIIVAAFSFIDINKLDINNTYLKIDNETNSGIWVNQIKNLVDVSHFSAIPLDDFLIASIDDLH